MSEVNAEDQKDYVKKLRPRKSGALADISNKIAAGIDAATKRVSGGGKKRKLSTSSTEQRSKSAKGSSANELDAHVTSDSLVDNPLTTAAADANNTSVSSSCSSSSAVTGAVNDSRLSDSSMVVADIDAINPNKIRRTFPLRMRSNDPAQCMGLLDDMYEIYYENEAKYRAHPYMANQEDLNNKMRSILVDWLVEVHYKFKLQTVTLYLCINLIDRYLSKESILRGKLQLVGVAALFIACKFEEVYPPEVRDFVYITDTAYDREQVLRMETSILTKLNYEVLVPTAHHFLSRYLNCIQASERTRLVANYYAERNLQEATSIEHSPRVFAGAAVYAALLQQNCQYQNTPLGKLEVWSRALREESNLQESDVRDCAKELVRHVAEETQTTSKRKLVAAKKKYGSEKHQKISELPLPSFD